MIKPDYPSVLLIYTGGTIGMIENPETGALEAFNFDQLQENVPELKRFNYRTSSYQLIHLSIFRYGAYSLGQACKDHSL